MNIQKILKELEHESELAHEEMRQCIKENYLQFDESKGYAREIVRLNIAEKKKVSSAEIISRKIDGKPYYEIKFQKAGEDDYTVGYGSYKLDYVIEWLNECFEFCGKTKASVDNGKDTNISSNGSWILVEEKLPVEHDSMFAKFKGTKNWHNGMFEKRSDEVNVTVEFEDGTRKTTTSYTLDGKWKAEHNQVVKQKVVAWTPFPEPYKGE